METRGAKVLITGSNRGIGKAVAAALAENGANLYLANRRPDPNQIEELKKLGAQSVTNIQVDLLDRGQIEKLVRDLQSEEIDILFNNAGLLTGGAGAQTELHGQGLAVPLALLLGYGVLKLSAALFNELRDVVFARVRYRAMRRLSTKVLGHLHRLSLRYHLERQSGAVSRDIERGTRSVSTILNYLVFSVLPVLVEFSLVAAILVTQYAAVFALVSVPSVLFNNAIKKYFSFVGHWDVASVKPSRTTTIPPARARVERPDEPPQPEIRFVKFSVKLAGAKDVRIAADFNKWNPDALPEGPG